MLLILSEKLGDKKILSLLGYFFSDITEAILIHRGAIYKYVGDQVIVTWKLHSKKNKNRRALDCYLLICDIIKKRSHFYLHNFGVAPEFRVGIHCGNIEMGEIGTAKREITYIGDILNTTSALKEYAKSME